MDDKKKPLLSGLGYAARALAAARRSKDETDRAELRDAAAEGRGLSLLGAGNQRPPLPR